MLKTMGQQRIVTEDLFLALAIEDYKNYDASINEQHILEIARQLATLGNFVEVDRLDTALKTSAEQIPFKEYASSALKQVFETIDVAFTWLEHNSGKACEETQNQPISLVQKKEAVLRGLFHITGLGSFTSLFDLLELAYKFLDISENPYKAKREHIAECLAAVEDKKPQLSQLVTEAGEILNSIILQENEFNHAKAFLFDKVVRQAKDLIESCNDYLATAKETIEELTKSMTIFKWCSRGIRLTGLGVTCYGIYNFTPSSSSLDTLAAYVSPNQLDLIEKIFSSKFDFVLKAGAYAVSGYLWMSLFPSPVYTFHDSLAGLKCKHLRLTKGLQDLERRLRTARDVLDGVKASKELHPSVI